jgi:AcrR family transcriptional regulator
LAAGSKVVEQSKKPVVRRGSYAVIGPATRARILNVALQCLIEVGYFGTTTLLVQKRARVSRGSLLNQFRTRADLMVAVSDHIIQERGKAFHRASVAADNDRQRFEELVDVQWDALRGPGGLARLEIYVAAVSDPGLKKRFEARNLRMDAAFRGAIWELALRLGVRDRAGVDLAVTTFTASLRGLALDLLYPRPGVDFDAAVAQIKHVHMQTLDRLIAAGKAKDVSHHP